MRFVLLAMTEDQHDHRSWRSTGLVAVLLLLTLTLNASAREQAALVREAYNDSNDVVLLIFTILVTVGQVLAVFCVISPETQRGDWPDKEASAIIVFSHVGTIFLHDFLLSLGSAHNFVLVSFLQPLLALVTLFMVTSTIARPTAWISVIVISLGCTFMSIKSSTVFETDRTSLICILSVFTMILRNIVIRHLVSTENVNFIPRKPKVLSGLALAAVMSLIVVYCCTSPIWLAPVFCAMSTCALSAALFYVTCQVLKTHNVTFLAIFHIWALLLEAIIITPNDHRPDLVTLIAGLAFIVLGHYSFFKDHVELKTSGSGGLIASHPPKPVHLHEQFTRIEFLLFTSMVMGVIFYVFQPQVSQRDLDTLSYVGLDKVIRRLLTVSNTHASHASLKAEEVQLP